MAGLFKVVVTSTVNAGLANPFVSVFGYKSNLAILDEEMNLASAFVTQHLPAIKNIVSNAMVFRRVEVYNVSNGTGYYDNNLSPTQAGTRSGDALPLFNAWGFQYNRVIAGKRHGYKRFGLVSESDTTGDGPTAAMATILNTSATTLGSPLTVGAIQQWFPEILERKPTGVYPWTSHAILNVQYKRITTQNSRKT